MFKQCARDRGEGDRFIVLGQVLVSFFFFLDCQTLARTLGSGNGLPSAYDTSVNVVIENVLRMKISDREFIRN